MTLLSACATLFDPDELHRLTQEAEHKGYVRVMVAVDVDMPLAPLSKQSPELKRQLAEEEQAILAELGNTVSNSGRWRNGLGQLGLYVTTEGLKRIENSAHVRKCTSTFTDAMRSSIYDDTGKLWSDIEAEISKNGFADVEVALNLENFAFDFNRSGKAVHKTSAAQIKEMLTKLPAFLNALPAKNILNLRRLKTQIKQLLTQSTLSLRIDQEGLFALKENVDIRALRLTQSPRASSANLDAEVLTMARKDGFAGVMISLYQPFGYSPLMGRLPPKAWQAQTTSLEKVFDDIFTGLGSDAVQEVKQYPGLPTAYARLSFAALKQLYQNPDPRIQRITLNRSMVQPQLATSTPWINMPQAWDKGYTANGQFIVVMDSGVQKSHPFLQQANGQPKVTYEACFSADQGNAKNFTSVCPNADSVTGDSPLGMVDSATDANCSGLLNLCFHGTHIAGIAAGRRNWDSNNSGGILSGMVPDASIIAVNVFSKTPQNTLSGLEKDVLDAMTTLAAVNNDHALTVNLSLGDYRLFSTCAGFQPAFDAAVAQLSSLNIPVIAATGNSGYRDSIMWPACVPGVIKAAASNNHDDNLWPPTNIINPALVDGAEFLAPGCAWSSMPGNGSALNCGTSMATPHIAGLYAGIKAAVPGISVQAATEWIISNAVQVTPFPGAGYTIPRIHVPDL
ncbi:MAG: S8/S53 family peptidase [Methylococcales bacterium]